jgi:hypothetical protein
LDAAQAAKDGAFAEFEDLLKKQVHLSFEDFNSLPPGRTFGVVHQVAFHGNCGALEALLTAHPRVDLKMLTKDGKTPEEVAVEEGADALFLGFLRNCVRRQNLQEIVSAAQAGEWKTLHALLASSSVVAAELNTVPIGRKWGVIHQVSYWGDHRVLETLVAHHPTLDLELETNEDTPQTPLDIAQGRGHKAYYTALQGLLKSATGTSGGGGGGGGGRGGGRGNWPRKPPAPPTAQSAVQAASSASSKSAVQAASSTLKVEPLFHF